MRRQCGRAPREATLLLAIRLLRVLRRGVAADVGLATGSYTTAISSNRRADAVHSEAAPNLQICTRPQPPQVLPSKNLARGSANCLYWHVLMLRRDGSGKSPVSEFNDTTANLDDPKLFPEHRIAGTPI